MSTEPATSSAPLPQAPTTATATEPVSPAVPTATAGDVPPPATAPGAFDIAAALRNKMTAEGLSITTAAKAINVNHVIVDNILSKGSHPNSRTASRFAAWLGVDVALITGGDKPRKRPAAKPPTDDADTASPATAKAEKDTGRRSPKRKASDYSTDEVIAIVRAAIKTAQAAAVKADKPAPGHPILKDVLAMAVHEAPAAVRSAIRAVMSIDKDKDK